MKRSKLFKRWSLGVSVMLTLLSLSCQGAYVSHRHSSPVQMPYKPVVVSYNVAYYSLAGLSALLCYALGKEKPHLTFQYGFIIWLCYFFLGTFSSSLFFFFFHPPNDFQELTLFPQIHLYKIISFLLALLGNLFLLYYEGQATYIKSLGFLILCGFALEVVAFVIKYNQRQILIRCYKDEKKLRQLLAYSGALRGELKGIRISNAAGHWIQLTYSGLKEASKIAMAIRGLKK